MTWIQLYQGNGESHEIALPPAPPWRAFPRKPVGGSFLPPPGLADAVNAALCLRRPLLITGPAGSGKSTVVESVAEELRLGGTLRWAINSRSTLTEGLYHYDVLGRIHAQQLGDRTDDIAPFLKLGPLGTALLPRPRPRALLIDEIDKGDLDLPSDLLDVLERGAYEIPELLRLRHPGPVAIRGWDSDETHEITNGRVQCAEFPFIVLTSNGERDFAAPFLRRCVRFTMPAPTDPEAIKRTVRAHLATVDPERDDIAALITEFATRVQDQRQLALDQLLNAVFLLSGTPAPVGDQRQQILDTVLRELSGA